LTDLFNSPISNVSFIVNSRENLDSISKTWVEEGKTEVNLSMVVDDKTLKFKLKNTRNLNRKSLNLLRKRDILCSIS
jgi:DNA polymerase-3 subunit alpha